MAIQSVGSAGDWPARWSLLRELRARTRKTWEPNAQGQARALVKQFGSLCHEAEQVMGALPPLEACEIAVAVALALMAPENSAQPSAALWRELSRVAAALPTPQKPLLDAAELRRLTLSRWLGLVVGWTCGWSGVSTADEEPPRPWMLGIYMLRLFVEGEVIATLDELIGLLPHEDAECLREIHPRLGRAAVHRGPGVFEVIVSDITAHLLKYCTCRPKCSRTEHRLSGWHVETNSFQQFVRQAVSGQEFIRRYGTGASQGGWKSKAFIEKSMLFPLLHLYTGLCAGGVVVSVCARPQCQQALVQELADVARAGQVRERRRQPKLKLSLAMRGVFFGTVCKDCRSPSEPGSTYHYLRTDQILLPSNLGGTHQPELRFRCATCWNYYDVASPPGEALYDGHASDKAHRCPICGGVRSQRRSAVWVRDTRRSVSADEHDLSADLLDPLEDSHDEPLVIRRCEGLGRAELLMTLELSYDCRESDELVLSFAPWPEAQPRILGPNNIAQLRRWRSKASPLEEQDLPQWGERLKRWWVEAGKELVARLHADLALGHARTAEGQAGNVQPIGTPLPLQMTLFVPDTPVLAPMTPE